MKYALLISEFLSTPWAMMPDRISSAAAIIARRINGDRNIMEDNDFGERQSAWETRMQQASSLGGGGIAVLPLYGTIVQRAGMMTEWCGGTSTQQFTAAFRNAMADNSVGGILIDVDSPGGSVYGVPELADEIYQSRGQKPIIAIANSLSASAAYWLGTAADEMYCTPGGETGSIGVWGAHEDYSKYLDEMGVKTTLISAGKFKVEGNPYEQLSDEARSFQQKRVDEYYAMFTKAVARQRGVPVGQVRDGMGQGRVLGPQDCQNEKMIDDIMTFDDAIKRLSKKMRSGGNSAAKPSLNRAAQSLRDLELLTH